MTTAKLNRANEATVILHPPQGLISTRPAPLTLPWISKSGEYLLNKDYFAVRPSSQNVCDLLVRAARREIAPREDGGGTRVRLLELARNWGDMRADVPRPLDLSAPLRVLARLADGATIRAGVECTALDDDGQPECLVTLRQQDIRSAAALCQWLEEQALPMLADRDPSGGP